MMCSISSSSLCLYKILGSIGSSPIQMDELAFSTPLSYGSQRGLWGTSHCSYSRSSILPINCRGLIFEGRITYRPNQGIHHCLPALSLWNIVFYLSMMIRNLVLITLGVTFGTLQTTIKSPLRCYYLWATDPNEFKQALDHY